MPSNISSAAVLAAPRLASQRAAAGSSSREIPGGTRTVGSLAPAAGFPGRVLTGVFSAFVGFAAIVVAGLAFPLAILAVGIPIVLLVRLAIWIVRALAGW